LARRSALSTAQPVTTSPPAASTSLANACATAWKSTTAVAGEWSASTPLTCGSNSAISSARSRFSPGTPLARPRRSSSSSRGTSPLSSATISLPSWRAGIPRSWQYASSSGAPSVHRRAFSEPGA
jgi:hypothetical protein